jgi:Lar family restriction alleviation protein
MEEYNKALDPCPFCGGEAEFVLLENHPLFPFEDDSPTGYVRCTKCGAEQGWSYSAEDAIERWNTRV